MQPEDRDTGFLWDMLDAVNSIALFVGDSDERQFELNDQLRSAVSWQVIVVGEAARRVSREFRDQTPQIDWQLLLRQRNFYAHDYDAVSADELWELVRMYVPRLAEIIAPLLPPLPPEIG